MVAWLEPNVHNWAWDIYTDNFSNEKNKNKKTIEALHTSNDALAYLLTYSKYKYVDYSHAIY